MPHQDVKPWEPVRVPFWSKWLGEIRARRRAAEERRRHEEWLATPALIGTVTQRINWTDEGTSEVGWVWHLYETGSGKRSFSLDYKHYLLKERETNVYARLVEWRAGLWNWDGRGTFQRNRTRAVRDFHAEEKQ